MVFHRRFWLINVSANALMRHNKHTVASYVRDVRSIARMRMIQF